LVEMVRAWFDLPKNLKETISTIVMAHLIQRR